MSTKEKEVVVFDPNANHVEAAQARLQDLGLMCDQIPRFVIPTSPKDSSRMNNIKSVPPEFVELTAVAVANQKGLAREGGATPTEVRGLITYADAYSPLADELEAQAQFVRFSVNAARYKAGAEALAIYAIAQRLAKLPETASLAPHVADMRRALGRVRKLTAEQIAKKKAEKGAKAGKTTTPPTPPAPKSE
jgi:hypothetical protein